MSSHSSPRHVLGRRQHHSFADVETSNSEGLFVTPMPEGDQTHRPLTRMADASAPISLANARAAHGGGDEADDAEANKQTDDDCEEDEDDDEGNDENVGYNDHEERLPDHPAFASRVEELQQQACGLVSTLQDIIKGHANGSADLEIMLGRATEAIEIPEHERKIVGLLGDTGCGKSSTVNSLTSILGLAKAVAAGESCTKVIMLFTHRLEGQQANFAADIRYSSSDTCRALLQEQLDHYHRYNFLFDEDWLDTERKEYENRSETAFKIFRSLFCRKTEFESPRAGKVFLESAYKNQIGPAIGKMQGWCNELLVDQAGESGAATCRFEADNVGHLNAQLSPHISEDQYFQEPSLCHLIEMVTVGVPCSRILRYLTLADLPGTSDTDAVRAAIAHKFLQGCDALLVFEPMARCVDHPSAERNIATNAERFGNKMALVVTRADDNADDALAEVMQRKGQSIGEYSALGRQVTHLDRQLLAIRRQLDGAKKKGTKRQKTAVSSSKIDKLRPSRSVLIEERQQLKNEQYECLVDARNTQNIRLLQSNKQRFMPPGIELAVLCVSNTHYTGHLGNNEFGGALLNVEATGIPALRAWLLKMVAPALLLSTDSHFGRCSTFVSGVSLWALNMPQKRKSSVSDIIKSPEKTWDMAVAKFLGAAKVTTQTSLLRSLNHGVHGTLDAALRYYEQLQTWHPSTIRAFFLKNGKHSTKAQPMPTCWNEHFTEHQTRTILNANWEKLVKEQRGLLYVAVEELVSKLRKIPTDLINNENAIATRLHNVDGIINEHVRNIRRAHAVHAEEHNKRLGNVKQNASFDEPGAYFSEAMRPMYDVCKNMKGKGCTKLMMATLSDQLHGLQQTSPYVVMADSLQRGLNDTASQICRDLQSDISEILSQIGQQFDAVLAVEQEKPQEKAARRELETALVHAAPCMERINGELEAIRLKHGIVSVKEES